MLANQIDSVLDRLEGSGRFASGARPELFGAAWIGRLVRNAFAHNPLAPLWKLDRECRGKVYEVPRVIKLDCRLLKTGEPVRRMDYGGPLALLRLSIFVRGVLLSSTGKSEL